MKTEDKKLYLKQWRLNHQEYLKIQRHSDYLAHRDNRNKSTASYRQKHPWLRFYVNAKQRCENLKCPSYKYYGARGIKFFLSLEEIKVLWFRDKAYLMKQPSIDRKKSDLHYTFDNCRFVERNINVSKKVESKLT